MGVVAYYPIFQVHQNGVTGYDPFSTKFREIACGRLHPPRYGRNARRHTIHGFCRKINFRAEVSSELFEQIDSFSRLELLTAINACNAANPSPLDALSKPWPGEDISELNLSDIT